MSKIPTITDPISTDEAGFYRMHFTIRNAKVSSDLRLTTRAIDVLAEICAGPPNWLQSKSYKNTIAKRLNVKSPRIYTLLSELEQKGVLRVDENKVYWLPDDLLNLTISVKKLLDKGIDIFMYALQFKIESDQRQNRSIRASNVYSRRTSSEVSTVGTKSVS